MPGEFPKRGEIWLVDLHKSRIRRGSFTGSISEALMGEIEEGLLKALGLTG
jgi:mRNA-degrading endonuclease toxin of MazEF toxin-antitoxin module